MGDKYAMDRWEGMEGTEGLDEVVEEGCVGNGMEIMDGGYGS